MVSEQADLVSNPLLTAAELDEMRKELAQLQLDMAEIKSWIKDSMKSKVEDRREMKEEAFDPGGNSASFTPSVTKAASFYDRNPRQPLDNLYRNRNNESQLQNQNDDDCMKRTKTILILNGMKFFEQLVMRKLLLNFSCVVLRRWCWCWDPGGFKLKTSEEQIKLRLEKELVSKTREEKGKAVDFNDANSDSEDEVMVMEEKEIGAGFVGTAIMTDDVVVIEKDPILMQPVPQRSNVERSRDRFLDACASVCFNASGISAVLIDDGIVMDKMHPLEWQWSNNPVVCRILRLERLAVEILEEERPKGSTWTLDLFTNKFKTKLNSLADKVVTLKSIAAYRSGLDISTNVRKEDAEKGLIEDTKAGPPIRIRNKRLIDYIFICSLEVALLFDLPLQIHTGFGDEDLDLRLNNPFHLRAVLEDSRFYKCRIVLLHASYPFLKEASYLASVYSQVHLDFGLAEKMSGEVEKMLDDSAFSVTDKMCHRMVHSYEVYVCKNWRDLEDTAAVIVAFLIGMLLEWRLALVAMATIPVLTVSAVAQKMWLAGFSRGMREMHRKVFLVLEDAVRNIYTVVAFCAGNKVMELYRLQLAKIFRHSFFHGMGIGLAFGFS